MSRFSQEYLENKRQHLIARRESKLEILKNGGLRASFHSDDDIVQIDFALKRIKAGQYGICLPCGAIIDSKRLDFTPEISRCIHCQEDHERFLKRALA